MLSSSISRCARAGTAARLLALVHAAPRFQPALNFSAAAAVNVTAALVKQLRDMTGAPMMECKNALTAEGGDIEKAVDWLRKKGVAAASKKAGRTTSQGLVSVAVSPSGDTGAIVELNSETDFVARNENFQKLLVAVTQSALTSVPPAKASVASSTGTGDAAVAQAVAALAAAPCPGAGAGTVAEAVTDVIAKVRENMVLRRAAKVHAPGGVVAAYTHNAISASLPTAGTIGVLVGLAPAGGAASPPLNPQHPAWPGLLDLGKKVAMHIAAAKPTFLSRDGVDTASLDRERAVLAEQAKTSGKPANIIAKMVEGRLSKYYSDVCLLDQPYILSDDGKTTVSKVVSETVKKLPGGAASSGITVTGFAYFVVGDGVVAAAEGAEK